MSKTFIPSAEQKAIFEFIARGTGNGIVRANAGTGKTTTLVEGAKLLDTSAVFVAFSKAIVGELEGRLAGTRMVAKTGHSIGLACIRKALGTARRPLVENAKYNALIKEWMTGEGEGKFDRDEWDDVRSRLKDLVHFCRMWLVSPSQTTKFQEVAARYDIILDGWEAPVVAKLLNQGEQVARQQGIVDFDDMLYLPAIWRLQPDTFRWVFVDECQDLTLAMQELVMKLVADNGGRILFVGDPNQAIFGFAGADSQSFWRLKDRARATEFPLSVCYRCPASHLDLARQIVPEIQNRPNAPVGVIDNVLESDLPQRVDGDSLVICRLTAPLVSACLDMLAAGINARVKGKDIAGSLVKMVRAVEKLKEYRGDFARFPELLRKYAVMQAQRLAQQDASEARIEALYDQVDAILAIHRTSEAKSANDLAYQIERLFSDERPTVWLSTVHRAKGLEAGKVFIMRPDKLPLTWPNQSPEEAQQERNLKYVAQTRAKSELYFVHEYALPAAPPSTPKAEPVPTPEPVPALAV